MFSIKHAVVFSFTLRENAKYLWSLSTDLINIPHLLYDESMFLLKYDL